MKTSIFRGDTMSKKETMETNKAMMIRESMMMKRRKWKVIMKVFKHLL